MVKVAIIGGTGYTGRDIIQLVARHPRVELCGIAADPSFLGKKIQEVFPRLTGLVDMEIVDAFDAKIQQADCIFFSLPHKVSMGIIEKYADGKKKLIDLSADFRFNDLTVYEKWYGVKHVNADLNKKFVYGLPELYTSQIAGTSYLANPGCFPTSIILALAPALKNGLVVPGSIICDSKTGVTGAGRKAALPLLFPEVNESVKAYRVGEHQHAPEMNQELSKIAGQPVEIMFVPHLVPINRGILSTIYCTLQKNITAEELVELYRAMYKGRRFVSIKDKGLFPELQDVVETNCCHIGIKVDASKKMLVLVSCLDNLLKGAAGQAVQNMNIMYGWDETLGF
jgi:N-acetyl-gamma-glutamyl-phosphate reductase